MTEYDRLVNILTDFVCVYCPVCAKKLDAVTAQTTIKNSGDQDSVISWRNKTCPDGHGTFGVDYRWGTHDGNPDAVFEANPDLFKICGHCGKPVKGHASAAKEWLCHPDEGVDCYRLVTVYDHPADAKGDCDQCKSPRRFDQLRFQTLAPEGHTCDHPKTACPGDQWVCPTCGRNWWAENDGLGSLYIWWMTKPNEGK